MALTTAELQILLTAKDLASRELDKAGQSADGLGKKITAASAIATAGFLALGAGAAKVAMDFEQSLSQVGAVAQATTGEMAKIRTEALAIGRDTAFSSRDAAKAMGELAAGGRSVAQILGGEARAAVDLAAAGNYNLADSGRTIATVMDVWKNSTINTTDVVNRLAGAANTSRFGVEDMSQAVAQAGGVAASMGVSFEDFSTAIAATASSFASGADAGTSFKTFLLGLDGTTDKAKEAIAALGLEFRNFDGSLKGIDEIAGELAAKVGVLGEAQQTAALKTIFGNDAYRTAVSLMDQAAEGVSKVDAALDAADASVVAAQRMDNLAGDVDALKGSLETMAISLGSQALPMLAGLAEGAVTAVNAFGSLPESTQNLALGFTAIAVAAPAAVVGIQKAAEFGRQLATASLSAKGAVGGLAVSVGAIAVVTDALLTKYTGVGLVDRVIGDPGRIKAANDAAQRWIELVRIMGKDVDPAVIGAKQLTEAIADYNKTMGDLERGGNPMQTSFGMLKDMVTGSESNDIQRGLKETEESVRNAFKAMDDARVPLATMHTLFMQLPPGLRAVADETANLTYGMAEAQGQFSAAVLDLDNLGKVALGLPAAAGPARTAVDDFMATVGEGAGKFDTAADALDNLIGKFADMNPKVLELKASNALLKEELGDLKRKGDDLSQAEKDRMGVIEDTIAANDDLIASYAENQDAMEGIRGHMQNLIGEAGYGGLITAMQNAKRDQDSQIEVAGKVSQAYDDLSKGGLTAARTKFQELKDTLSPAEWAALAQAVGPEVLKAIEGGLSADKFATVIQGMADVGADIIEGLRSGMASASNRIANEARGIARIAEAEIRAELQSQSPSRVFMSVGRDVAEGLALGMEQGTRAFVMGAAADMAGAAIAALDPADWGVFGGSGFFNAAGSLMGLVPGGGAYTGGSGPGFIPSGFIDPATGLWIGPGSEYAGPSIGTALRPGGPGWYGGPLGVNAAGIAYVGKPIDDQNVYSGGGTALKPGQQRVPGMPYWTRGPDGSWQFLTEPMPALPTGGLYGDLGGRAARGEILWPDGTASGDIRNLWAEIYQMPASEQGTALASLVGGALGAVGPGGLNRQQRDLVGSQLGQFAGGISPRSMLYGPMQAALAALQSGDWATARDRLQVLGEAGMNFTTLAESGGLSEIRDAIGRGSPFITYGDIVGGQKEAAAARLPMLQYMSEFGGGGRPWSEFDQATMDYLTAMANPERFLSFPGQVEGLQWRESYRVGSMNPGSTDTWLRTAGTPTWPGAAIRPGWGEWMYTIEGQQSLREQYGPPPPPPPWYSMTPDGYRGTPGGPGNVFIINSPIADMSSIRQVQPAFASEGLRSELTDWLPYEGIV